MVIRVIPNKVDELAYVDLWSNCCWVTVLDQWNTGEWICSDCKEHCIEHISREADIAVLNFMWGTHAVEIHRIEYDNTEYETIDECVEHYLSSVFGDTSNLQYLYNETSPIIVLDHRVHNNK